jgi:hypothetical protein
MSAQFSWKFALLMISYYTIVLATGCEQDSRLVIDRYKTGFYPPSDVPFEDLSNMAASQGNNGNAKCDGTTRAAGTASVRGKKRVGLRGIFGAPKVTIVLHLAVGWG